MPKNKMPLATKPLTCLCDRKHELVTIDEINKLIKETPDISAFTDKLCEAMENNLGRCSAITLSCKFF